MATRNAEVARFAPGATGYGSGMRTVLTVFGAIGFVLSIVIFASAANALQEIEGELGILIGVVMLGCGAIVGAVENLRRPQVPAQLPAQPMYQQAPHDIARGGQ